MISTKKIIISSIRDVPTTWIFEYYLSLADKLYGQEIVVKSVFNSTEKTPSMTIYPDKRTGKYKFKDFSSGTQGDAYDLVKQLFSINASEAVFRVLKDYGEYVNLNCVEKEDITIVSKFKVSDYEARSWNTEDAKYWMSYGISSKTLEKYNVMPLEAYKMNNGEKEITINNRFTYGYFRADGLIYKIYQPKLQGKKFIKVRSCIQGHEQLTYGKPNLVIQSSLKDLMSFEQLGFKTIECVAPDSENTMIPDAVMWELIKKYETVITVFDNDEAGKKAIMKYKERYGINGFALDLEKDVSDSVLKHGKAFVKSELVPLLTECIHTCKRCPESSTLE
jgi:hypothetical protein